MRAVVDVQCSSHHCYELETELFDTIIAVGTLVVAVAVAQAYTNLLQNRGRGAGDCKANRFAVVLIHCQQVGLLEATARVLHVPTT